MKEKNSSYNLKKFLITLIRFLTYGMLIMLLAEFLRLDASNDPLGSKFAENSLTEKLQSLMLFITSCIFLFSAFKYKRFSMISLSLFGFVAASLIREQDVYLDEWFFHGSWKIGSFGILILTMFIILKNFKNFIAQVSEFSATFVFGLIINGILTTYIFSRLIGRKIFWMLVMEDRYFRDVKNAAEECLELYGYLLILIATVEYLIDLIYDENTSISASSDIARSRERLPATRQEYPVRQNLV
ncbi:hypothetical protein [Pedobacter sp.]|uniref:hypothetical protein n=1 Tax=Pedobacter sp. TaxID=1411316 RepID=UPI003C4CC011